MTRWLLLACAGLFCSAALADDLQVSDAWIRLLPANVPAAGYFTLHNGGKANVALVGATSDAFGHVMLHRTATEAGQSRMMDVNRIDVAPGGTVAFAPGGYHLMMMQPRRAIAVGEKVPVTLQLAGGGRVTAEFAVRGPAGR